MKELINSISKKEWLFVFLMTLVIIFITTVPYIYAFATADPGTEYNGLHSLSPGDPPIYYSYIKQAEEGNFFLKNLFTSEPQKIGTLNVWWSLVGIFGRILNLTPVIAFQAFRVIMIPVFVIMAYIFISYFFNQEKQRKITLIFLLFSGGIGAYFSQLFDSFNWGDEVPYRWPIDLWLTESTTFNVLYQTSHFIASITLTILIFLLMLLAFKKLKLSYALISGFLALFYFNFHPYYFPVIFGVLGIYLFVLFIKAKRILWQQVSYLLVVFFISIPSVIYHFWLINNSEVVAYRALQNVTLISSPLFVIIGYGFLLPGFLLGLYAVVRKKDWNNKFTFLFIWITFNLVMAHSSFPFQTRYTQGVNFVLIIFTVYGLFYWYQYLKKKISAKKFDFWVNNPALWLIIFLFLFCGSTVYSLIRDIYYFTDKPGRIKEIFYLDTEIIQAMNWLDSQDEKKIILANDIPAKFIPSFSAHTVYIGHAHETLFPDAKTMEIIWFFGSNESAGDIRKRQFLIENNIDYIFYSQYEKSLGRFNPEQKDYLKLVFDLPKAKVYQLIKE